MDMNLTMDMNDDKSVYHTKEALETKIVKKRIKRETSSHFKGSIPVRSPIPPRRVLQELTDSSSDSDTDSVDDITPNKETKIFGKTKDAMLNLGNLAESVGQLVTAKYYRKKGGRKYRVHILKEVHMDGFGLKEYDEIIQINGRKVWKKSHKKVKKAFKKLRPQTENTFSVIIVVRRWVRLEEHPDTYERQIITLTVEVTIQNGVRSVRFAYTSEEDPLPPGNVAYLHWSGKPKTRLVRFTSKTGGWVLTATKDYRLKPRVLSDTSTTLHHFRCRYFSGVDEHPLRRNKQIFGMVLMMKIGSKQFYLTSRREFASNDLELKAEDDCGPLDIATPDERFFIIHQNDSWPYILESMLYRDYCIHLDKDDEATSIRYLDIQNVENMTIPWDHLIDFCVDILKPQAADITNETPPVLIKQVSIMSSKGMSFFERIVDTFNCTRAISAENDNPVARRELAT